MAYIGRWSGILAIIAVALARTGSAQLSMPRERPWQAGRSCLGGQGAARLEHFGSPDSTLLPDRSVRFCVRTDSGQRVCLVRADSLHSLTLEDARGLRLLWSQPPDWDTWDYRDGLDVLRGDLDGDGHPELIVAEMFWFTNGSGHTLWHVFILNGARPADAPVVIQTEEFGRYGSFITLRGSSRCQFLHTEWRWLSDPHRGPGLYLVGTFWHYDDGALVPNPALPVVARRLLNSFVREQGDDQKHSPFLGPWPFKWFSSANTQILRGATPEPVDEDSARRYRAVVVASRPDSLALRLSDSTIVRYPPPPPHFVTGPNPHWVHLGWRLRDSRTGRFYPAGFLPATLTALSAGTSVTLIVHYRPWYSGDWHEIVVP
jgi:hypothetical protein